MMENNMEAPELLPCPFCGGEAELHRRDNRPAGFCQNDTDHWISCNGNDCLASVGMAATREEAITAWNCRADLAAPSALDLVQNLVAIEMLTATGEGLDPETTMQVHLLAGIGRAVDDPLAWHTNAAPSAPAEVEGLDYAAIDAIRMEAFRTNDPATKQRFLKAAGRWFQYEDCREMDRATALTALQAENERLRGDKAALIEISLDQRHNNSIQSASMAALLEKAEAERDAWKANAEELRSRLVSWCGDESDYSEDNDTLASHAKLKGEV